MSEGLTRLPLRQLCRVVSGSTPPTSVPEYWGTDFAWVTPADLSSMHGGLASDSARRVSVAGVQAARLEVLPAGTVILSSRAPIGYVAVADMPVTINQGCKALVCGDGVDPQYVMYALMAQMPAIEALGRGATFAEVSKSAIEDVELRFHSPPAQRSVAQRLHQSLAEASGAGSAVKAQLELAARVQSRVLVAAFGAASPIALRTSKRDSSWNWLPLMSLARLESGHTPSRRHPEWWGGDVPWLALPDIRKLHGKLAHRTAETINDSGLANSSARLLPVGTVCVSRTASIGFVTLLGRPMATSQDFCNWVCDSERLDPEFLMYAFMASQEHLRELGSGAVHKTIYMPTIESFHIHAPAIAEQRRIAYALREQLAAAEALHARLAERQAEIERLPQRILAAAFGEAA